MANDEATQAALRRVAASVVLLGFLSIVFLSPPTLFFAQVSGLGPDLGSSQGNIPVTTRMDPGDARQLSGVFDALSPWRRAPDYLGVPDASSGELTAAATVKHPDIRIPVSGLLVYTSDPDTLVAPAIGFHDAGYRFITPQGGLDKERRGDLVNIDVADDDFAQDYWLTPEEGNRFQGFVTARRYLVEKELEPPGPDGEGGKYDRQVVLTMFLSERRIDRDSAVTYIRVSIAVEPIHNWTAAGTYTEAAGRLMADLVPALFEHRPPAPFLGVQIFRSGILGALAVVVAFVAPSWLLIDHAKRLNEARIRNLERMRFEAATRGPSDADKEGDEGSGQEDGAGVDEPRELGREPTADGAGAAEDETGRNPPL